MSFIQGYARKLGVLEYKGTWNASTNTPNLQFGQGSRGAYYIVSTSGSTELDGISSWEAGDWVVHNGTNWQRIDAADKVKINEIENFKFKNEVYVSLNGSDTTGTGSALNPYATIGHALSSITDASPSNRYAILLQAGIHAHEGTLSLKPDIDIIGVGGVSLGKTCKITADSYNLHSSWTGAGDKRSLIKNVGIANPTTPSSNEEAAAGAMHLDYQSVTSQEGKVYFENVFFETDLHITGYSQVNQGNIYNCYLYWNYIQKGTMQFVYNTTFWGWFSTIESYPSGLSTALQSYFYGAGCTFYWDLNVNGPSGRSNLEVYLFNSAVGALDGTALNVDGSQAVLKATEDSLPKSTSVNVLNGGQVQYLNDKHVKSPSSEGASGQVLTSDGSGGSNWTSALLLKTTSSASDPSTSDLASGEAGLHRNTSNGKVFLAYNDNGTIKKTELA